MRLAIKASLLLLIISTWFGTFGAQPSREVEAADCRFILGFKALHDAIPDVVGDCKVNEHYNIANGDALQETVGGLLVWRKADNFTAFTDGYRTWVNGPYGIQQRLNTQRYEWELEIAARNNPEAAVKADPSICDFIPGETRAGDVLGPLLVPCFNQYVASLPPLSGQQPSAPASAPAQQSVPCAALPYIVPKGATANIDKAIKSMGSGSSAPVEYGATPSLPADIAANCTGPAASSGGLKLNLTRVDQDWYKDTLSGGYVHTFACYEYVYYQDALLFSDRVIFLTPRAATCQLAL